MSLRDLFGLSDPSLPASYLQIMLGILQDRGLPENQLMKLAGIDPAVLSAKDAHISPLQWALVVAAAIRATGNGGLGYEQGLRMRATHHGFVGYAAMSSATMEDALEVAVRFVQSRQRTFTLCQRVKSDHCEITFNERHSIPVLRSFFYETVMVGLLGTTSSLIGIESGRLEGVEVLVDWPEPDYHLTYRDRLPAFRFSQSINAIRMPMSYLKRPMPLADPYSAQKSIEICVQELAIAGGNSESIVEAVSKLLMLTPHGGYPNATDIANMLHVSDRTLKRKLQESGTSFRALLDQASLRDAKELLGHRNLGIDQVAERLGYLNPANFARAFKKGTGMSPRDFRNSLDTAKST